MKRQSNRAFAFTVAAFLAVIWTIAYWAGDAFLVWPIVAAGAFVLFGLIAPSVLLPLNRVWVVLLGIVGHVNNRIVLGVFFYLIVVPFGALMRLFGADPMHKRPQPDAASYFTPVRRQANSETYSDMF